MPRERREQQILDVAGAIFARAGYHSASMDEIADAAGVSKPMLYAYFSSKEGLYLAYIKRAGGQLLERLVSARARDDAPGAPAGADHRVPVVRRGARRRLEGAVRRGRLDPSVRRERRRPARADRRRDPPHDRGRRRARGRATRRRRRMRSRTRSSAPASRLRTGGSTIPKCLATRSRAGTTRSCRPCSPAPAARPPSCSDRAGVRGRPWATRSGRRPCGPRAARRA